MTGSDGPDGAQQAQLYQYVFEQVARQWTNPAMLAILDFGVSSGPHVAYQSDYAADDGYDD